VSAYRKLVTWTLRFYEEDGTEIGWVTSDPWQVEITHPEPDRFEDLRSSIESLEEIRPSPVTYRDNQFSGHFDFDIITDPEAHLERVRDYVKVGRDIEFSLTHE
jgi:hypothetical protein